MIPQHDLQAYRQQLLALRSALLLQITEQRGGSRGRAEVAADHFMNADDSRAQMASARELEFAINEHETGELNELEAALERLDAGTYGLCIDCGVAIPEARLKAKPEVRRCLACQEVVERAPRVFRSAKLPGTQ